LRVKNRMRVIRSSGSVRGGDGDIPAYSASGKNDVTTAGQPLESGITIDMQDALEPFEMRDGTLCFAVRRKDVDCGGRRGSAPWSLIARIDPEPSRLGAAAARIEHRNRRIVGEEMIGGEHILAEPFMQGFEPPTGAADPIGKRRAIELDAVAREDLRLPIERRVVAIFADQHLSKQSWRRNSASYRPFWGARLGDLAAAAASIFGPPDAHDAQLRGNPIQHLTHAFADGMESMTATRAVRTIDAENDVLARQMIGQRLALGPRIRSLRGSRRSSVFSGLGSRQIGVEVFEAER
jgi:hypothetical protein